MAICLLWLAACAGAPPTPEQRRASAQQLASAQGWFALPIDTRFFTLTAFLPSTFSASKRLTVYIEGDGFAWISSEQASTDPTPIQPTALQLALAQPEGNAVYLGRPCQYGGAAQTPCAKKYWTNSRFAPEVIEASNSAIDNLKARFGANRLVLVGYSGGGAVAALLAARRDDVERLITVAGNLDHRAWTEMHYLRPLTGSLNPADFRVALSRVPQWHFVGGDDRNIPDSIARSFVADFPARTNASVQVVPQFDHHCCWVRDWPSLWSAAMADSPLRSSAASSSQP